MMEDIVVIKDIKTELEIEVHGESHSICNILRKYLMEVDDVKHAVYGIDHPLIGNPIITIKTSNKKTPKKSLLLAANKVKDTTDEFKRLIESIND
ncbi:MAG: DNA-directed RNA polymerase subunit L [Methanobrevibacter sp.]|jgi:DNA-directed RNA polymerase subunit L|nr:DNA-directed RNA polymerase subunit L [Candidatus Methanovirga aequatorialis]